MNDTVSENVLQPKVNLAEKLMVVRLNCSYSFSYVTDRKITDETNTNKHTKALRVQKERFPKESGDKLRALQNALISFYQYHKKVTMSSASDGERLLPVAFYLDYTNEFNDADVKVKQAYQDFEDDYDNAILKAQPLLGDAFSPTDYPPKSELPKLLNFRKQILPLPDGSTLLSVIGESVQSDVDTYINEAVTTAYADVRDRVKKTLENVSKVMSNPNGRVHDSLFSNLIDLVAYLPEFNVDGSSDLTELTEDIKSKLLVFNAGQMKDRSQRSSVADATNEILRKMG